MRSQIQHRESALRQAQTGRVPKAARTGAGSMHGRPDTSACGALRTRSENWPCKEQRTFTVKTCGKHKPKKTKDKTTKAEECPDKAYSQGPCKMGYRNLFTFSYTYSADLKRCIKHVALKREQCAALVATEACPSDDTVETGPCKSGFRTSILYHYSRNTEGHCQKNVKKVTSPCRSKKATECPPKRVKKVGGCEDRIQRWLTVYFEWNKLKGRCVKKFRAREKPCREAASGSTGAAKSKKCPKRRVMEPGPCIDGSRKVLVEHYEYSEKRGRCIAHRDFMHQKCGEKAKKKKKKSTPGVDLKHECPEKTVNQGACRKGGYRTVSTVYFVFVKALGRCVRKVKQEDEKCALLVKLASCPKDDVVETGPCHRGFRTNIIYQYTRDLEGRCARAEKSVTEECKGSTADCLPPSRKLAKPCSASGFERWLTTYYVYNKLKKRCVRKLRVKEVSCRRVKKCPTPRVIEPSPCSKGKQRLLIEHYELDAKLGRCRMKQDYVNRKCGKPTKRQAAAAKHHCPDSTYHQKPCRKDGYRSVLKIYYRYNSAKGRCVRNVRVDDEKCSRLVATRATCKADEMVEEGPCKKGFRENIIYRYERNKDGSCVRKERRVSLACVEKKVVP
ncbi:hypothetical protein BOX15_Mlig000808g3 [Macrostomum lignano]|uniref:Uncharacterized protein n=1 Tax=Macrostomum lignano TaxID=282301 RepID=A0A267FTF9_9PLAT|nr:hypothetical protein BOX15_Mlig000808g3 [Macrostomum lignano]